MTQIQKTHYKATANHPDKKFMYPNTFKLFGFPIFRLSLPDEGYSRNASCILNLMSPVFFTNNMERIIHHIVRQGLQTIRTRNTNTNIYRTRQENQDKTYNHQHRQDKTQSPTQAEQNSTIRTRTTITNISRTRHDNQDKNYNHQHKQNKT